MDLNIVTLERSEYDHLKDLERKFNQLEVNFRDDIPTVALYKSFGDREVLKILSGESKIKEYIDNFDLEIKNLKDQVAYHKKRHDSIDEILKKLKDVI